MTTKNLITVVGKSIVIPTLIFMLLTFANMAANAYNEWNKDRQVGFIEGQQEQLHLQAEQCRQTLEENSREWEALEAQKVGLM